MPPPQPSGVIAFGPGVKQSLTVGESASFSLSEGNYNGAFTGSSSNPSALAVTIANNIATVTAISAGNATISFADQFNNVQTVNVVANATQGGTPTGGGAIPTYGGLTWIPVALADGTTGYNSAAPSGGYYFFGADLKLYLDNYAGVVQTSDTAANLIGYANTYDFSSSAGSGDPNSPPTTGGGSGPPRVVNG